ncbi:MAG: CapA family protein [Ruminococcaceae bacterium]|nr:CapA family protein [Oscillospiraceae bacterium]
MSRLRVALMGDICMEGIQERMNPAYAKQLLAPMQKLLQSCDLRVANLENAICSPDTPIRKCGPNLWQTPENLCFLREAGIDCTVLANNHVGDFGPEPVMATIDELHRAGFPTVGAGANLDEAYIPWITEKNGIRLAVVAVCENEFGGATLTEAGTAAYDLHRVAKTLKAAHTQADFVVLVMHGGNEYNPLPSPRVRARYRTFVDLGADAVIGMHPHCIQGYEIYEGSPIVYSTGNFLFPGFPSSQPSWFRGYVPELTLEKGKPIEITVHPYSFDKGPDAITPDEGETKATMLAYIDKLSAYIADEAEIRRLFDGWTMITGPDHAALAGRFEPEYEALTDVPKGHPMYAVRNIRTCEAHNELVTNYCRMIVEGRIAAGKIAAGEVRALQKMPV